MALIFGFSPLIAGLIGHVILRTQKLIALQWTGMAIAIAGLNFCLCLLCRQQSEPLGCGDVWDCDVFLERMVRTIFC